jgi:F-type H+-transporting ATPase subunit a
MTTVASYAILAAGDDEGINPGQHWTVDIGGWNFNLDTIIGTLVAAAIVCGAGLYMASRATKGRPSGLQVAFEALTGWVRTQVRDGMGLRAPKGVVELGVALFAFILICNWIAALPSEHYIPAPTSDVALVYPLMLFVIVWINVEGFRKRGVGGYFGHWATNGAAMVPIEIITLYISRPASLALRLWGNIFAGGIMVAIIGLIPWYVAWIPNAGWKLFDMFIGVIQALIFTLLTIIYFSDSVGSDADAH